jgi:hypothetical protein
VKQIIHNNKYDTSILNRNRSNGKNRNRSTEKRNGPSLRMWKRNKVHQKLFKNTNVKVVYTTKNNLSKLLAVQAQKTNKYDGNGIYQLEYPTCNKKYTGQTGRPFRVRFREHNNAHKYANNRSKFAQHVIDEGHSFGPMNDIMKIVHVAEKGRILDTLEKIYIYRETKYGNQINDKLAI